MVGIEKNIFFFYYYSYVYSLLSHIQLDKDIFLYFPDKIIDFNNMSLNTQNGNRRQQNKYDELLLLRTFLFYADDITLILEFSTFPANLFYFT